MCNVLGMCCGACFTSQGTGNQVFFVGIVLVTYHALYLVLIFNR